MVKNVEIKLAREKSECCGCGLCAMICPMKAIEMNVDLEGFLYPKIDMKKCIKCRKCETNCIMK